jgi:hypothetical protein
VLQRFAKPLHLFGKLSSFGVGNFVLRRVRPKRLWQLSWDIQPFGATRLGPTQNGVVAALLGEEQFISRRFLFPTGLSKLGLNLAPASFDRNPLSLRQTERTCTSRFSALCSRVRARSPFLCVLLMWSALSHIGHRVGTPCPVLDTPSTRTVSLVWMTIRGSLHSVAAQSPDGVIDAFRLSHPSFSSSLDALLNRASLQESQERRKRLLALTFCSPSAKSRSRANSNFASLLICNLAIQRKSRMNCASEALMLCSFITEQCCLPGGVRLASTAVAHR